MPRKARIVIPGLAHHVTQRGNNQQIIFKKSADYFEYSRLVVKYSALNELEILAFCLMPNHVHFIVIPKNSEDLSITFQLVNMQYARYVHQKKGTSGHLWQGRFYSCAMDDSHLYRALRYVERNPVRGQLVKFAWDYPWSSARWHLGLSKKSRIYLKGTTIVNQNEWEEYLTEGDQEFEKNLRAKTRKGLAVGNPKFITEMEGRTGRILHSLKAGRRRAK